MRCKLVVLGLALAAIPACGGGGDTSGRGGLVPIPLQALFDRLPVGRILSRQANQSHFTFEHLAGVLTKWSSSTLGVPDKLPNLRTDIRRSGVCYAYMDAGALSALQAEFPAGQGPTAFRVDGTPNPSLAVGLYAYYWMLLGADFPLLESLRRFQYAFVLDQDGKDGNNYEGSPPYDLDFFLGTDLWFELTKVLDGAWTLTCKDARDGVITPLSTLASVFLLQNLVCLMVPMSELCEANYPPKVRFTAFEDGGDYGLAPPHDWFGSDRPFRLDRLSHIATSGLLREGPKVELSVDFLSVRSGWLGDLGVSISALDDYEPASRTRFAVRNGVQEDLLWDAGLFGGVLGAFQLQQAGLGRRNWCSEVTYLSSPKAADYATFLRTPGWQYFDPDLADARRFGVSPSLDYDVAQEESGLPEIGELHGLLGDAMLRTNLLFDADTGVNTSRYTAPPVLLNHGQLGAIQLIDRTADRTNVEAGLLGTIDTHFPGLLPDALFETGPLLQLQPTITPDLEVSLRIDLGVRGLTVLSPEPISVGGVSSRIRTLFAAAPEGGIRSRVIVPDGGTVLLGGLKPDGDTVVQGGVPLLMNLPLLSHLFSPSTKHLDDRELVIMITPRIRYDGAYEDD